MFDRLSTRELRDALTAHIRERLSAHADYYVYQGQNNPEGASSIIINALKMTVTVWLYTDGSVLCRSYAGCDLVCRESLVLILMEPNSLDRMMEFVARTVNG